MGQTEGDGRRAIAVFHIARKGAVLVRSVIAVTVSAERLFERLKHGLRLLNFRERLSIAF